MSVLWPEGPLHRSLPESPKSLGSPVAERWPVSLTLSSPPGAKRFSVPVSMCTPSGPLQSLALVDSGAEDNFMDETMALQAGFPSEPLESDPGNGTPGRRFVPDVVRTEVLQWGHCSAFACHPGAN